MSDHFNHANGTLEATLPKTKQEPETMAAPTDPPCTNPSLLSAEHADTASSPARTTLLSLPPQIRAQIYALAFSPSLQALRLHNPMDTALLGNDVMPINSRPEITRFSRPPALALVSSGLRADVLEWWYGSHTFLLQVHNAMTLARCAAWVERVLGEPGVAWLRKLRLRGNVLVYDRMHLRSVRTFPELQVDLRTQLVERVGVRDEGVGVEFVEGRLAGFERAWAGAWGSVGRKGDVWTVESLVEVSRAFVAVSAEVKPVRGFMRA